MQCFEEFKHVLRRNTLAKQAWQLQAALEDTSGDAWVEMVLLNNFLFYNNLILFHSLHL